MLLIVRSVAERRTGVEESLRETIEARGWTCEVYDEELSEYPDLSGVDGVVAYLVGYDQDDSEFLRISVYTGEQDSLIGQIDLDLGEINQSRPYLDRLEGELPYAVSELLDKFEASSQGPVDGLSHRPGEPMSSVGRKGERTRLGRSIPEGSQAAARKSQRAQPTDRGHAFVAYVREDAERVDQLQTAVEGAGIPVWRDIKDLWPGDRWKTNVREAITSDAFAFIPCFSHYSAGRESSTFFEELNFAAEEYRRRNPDIPWIFPVLLDNCVLPSIDLGTGLSLADLQWAQLFDDWTRESERLIVAVQQVLPRSAPADGQLRVALAEELKQGEELLRYADPPSPTRLMARTGRAPTTEDEVLVWEARVESLLANSPRQAARFTVDPPEPNSIGDLARPMARLIDHRLRMLEEVLGDL